MSKTRYEIVNYDIPLWLKPTMSVTEAAIYTGLSANKIYEMTSDEKCPFVIWVGSRRVIKENRLKNIWKDSIPYREWKGEVQCCMLIQEFH